VTTPAPPTLAQVRQRLQAQGYLDAGLERAIFSADRAVGVLVPTVVAGAVAAATASAAAIAARGAVAPSSGVWLVFLLLAAVELPAAAVFAALLYFATRLLRPPQRPVASASAAGWAAAAAVFGLFSAGARSLPAGAGIPLAIPLAAVGAATFYFTRALRATVLALTLRRQVPEALPRLARGGAAVAVGLFLLLSAAVLRRGPSQSFPALTVESAARSPLVILALDGYRADAVSALLPGAAVSTWRRGPAPPPEIWTTIATGVAPRRHGVFAFERVWLARNISVSPPWGTSWIFRGPLRALGLAGRLPVSAGERRAWAFWEVASRAGVSSVVVGWWASDTVRGAAVAGNSAIAALASSGPEFDAVAAARFRRERERSHPRLAVVYLPGSDISGSGPTAAARALVAEEIRSAVAGKEILWAVFDEGRGGHAGGLAAVAGSPAGPIGPENVAATILARLGLPVARDIGPPAAGLAASPMSFVESYGPRDGGPRAAPSPSGREYLEKLRSLGYLQ
jgi:hypothetical protein